MRWFFLLLVTGNSCASSAADAVPTPPPEVVPQTSSAVVPESPALTVLGEYTTFFEATGKYEGRAKNIETVVSRLNGLELASEGVFSFNQVVGERSLANGFFEAPEIHLGEMVPGVGGGTCQVSSTLYAAAIYANLRVLERRGHSRPLKYIGPGLDATVAFSASCRKDPNACSDLRLQNPYPAHLKLEVTVVPEGRRRKLVVRILGSGLQPPQVTTRWAVNRSTPFHQRVRKTGKYLGKWKKRVQSGSEGIEGVLVVQGGRVRLIPTSYPPVDEIWEVGLGWDMAEKPWP